MLDSFSKNILTSAVILMFCGCASSQMANAPAASDSNSQLIENPFGAIVSPQGNGTQNITFRTKRGDQAVEVEIPQGQDDISVPMGMKVPGEKLHGATAPNGVDYQYSDTKATIADREIASTFGKNNDPEKEAKQRGIEQQLGLQQSDELPNMDESYLAHLDVVKQLFKSGRYEATLIEIDHLVKQYPTNPRLYEMRGTVLDRMGYQDLAMRSWKQALEFDSSRLSLKKFIDKREQQRAVASVPEIDKTNVKQAK